MVDNYRFRFAVKPNRYCYTQTKAQQDIGRSIKSSLEAKWNAPTWCFHLQPGGHISALNQHVTNSVYSTIDLANFFGNVGRSKIIRCLKRIGFSYSDAKEIAMQSTVRDGNVSFVPYGFVQSPLLATIALVESHFGRALVDLEAWGITISVYVDDIILSHPTCSTTLINAYEMLLTAANTADFDVNGTKSQPPSTAIVAFNIVLKAGELSLTDDKMLEFRSRIVGELVGPATLATIRYAESVNPDQGISLRQEVGLCLA